MIYVYDMYKFSSMLINHT